jgi:hypothetical protein
MPGVAEGALLLAEAIRAAGDSHMSRATQVWPGAELLGALFTTSYRISQCDPSSVVGRRGIAHVDSVLSLTTASWRRHNQAQPCGCLGHARVIRDDGPQSAAQQLSCGEMYCIQAAEQ